MLLLTPRPGPAVCFQPFRKRGPKISTNTLYEPKIALEKGTGYVGWGAVGDELFFPHVDSCCALAVVLDNKSLVGGHVPLQWGGMEDMNAGANMKKIYDLIDVTRRNHVGNRAVTGIIAVGPAHWTIPYGVILKNFDPDYAMEFPALRIDTQATANGVDVTIKSTVGGVTVDVVDFKSKLPKSYAMPDDSVNKTF